MFISKKELQLNNKQLLLRVQSLEDLLGVSYAKPEDINSRFSVGEHYFNSDNNYDVLNDLKTKGIPLSNIKLD